MYSFPTPRMFCGFQNTKMKINIKHNEVKDFKICNLPLGNLLGFLDLRKANTARMMRSRPPPPTTPPIMIHFFLEPPAIQKSY